ncbi:ATP-binding protein [Olsenella sp. HMSC062G07]|uniref:ATP-binding protein n=1 Tax=Olsenella sp. HMSC062G07 TaxID=1739330 RepID=UPI0008A4943E|nr:4Fe-4S binding protein [Olsenella sp. HMSC062G07]OFK24140.1 4Fe-4S ferredoxin [Olsenella sp. HMSC062G07]
MIRKIIHIDEEKCNGCGLCATACHEGAIDIVDGKAKLVRENFCDGFGDCLPNCPTGAITFEEREAPEYDDAAVKRTQEEAKNEAMKMTVEEIMQVEDENERRKLMMAKMKEEGGSMPHGGCPGSRSMQLAARAEESPAAQMEAYAKPIPRLAQWPCQIKLVPTEAPFFDGAKLLIAADCTAYAYANMHEEFMRGRVTLIGCPKLDDIDYSEKLTEIIKNNDIREVTIVRMEVPCCGGLEMATKNALQASGKFIPWRVVTISRDGKILD